MTHIERSSVVLAGELLQAGGNAHDAALLFERAGDIGRAAHAYELLGDIENMERCHEKLDNLRGAKRASSQLSRKVESLIESGERSAALKLMDEAPLEVLDEAGLLNQQKSLAERLCRGRAFTLRIHSNHGELIRVSGLPAIMGRQPGSAIHLRDPSVSRQHAMIVAHEGQFGVKDAGSRSGITIANARLAGLLPIRSQLELGLSQTCRVRIEPLDDADAANVLRIQGIDGVDRSLLAFVVHDHFDLRWAVPHLSGVRIGITAGGRIRLERLASQPVRVAGFYVGLTCDLVLGDIIEVMFNGNPQPIVMEVLV